MIGLKTLKKWGYVCAIAIGFGLTASPATAARDIPMTPRQTALVKDAEAAINRIQTLRARFMQATSNGDVSEGMVYMSRPGRLRIEYDPPTPVLIVANGDYFTFVDTQLQQFSYLDLDATPAGLLLKPKVSLSGKDVRIRAVTEGPGFAEVTVVSTKDPTSGSLVLVFTLKPFELRQWRVIDAQGITTAVTLQNPQMDMALQDDLFETPRAP